jgi:catechol 2,3-dioxygenase-like lactoylglutathione lyase family enzyme
MTILRMDNVLIVVDDLDAVISFFVELGMELEGKGPIEGRWVERVIGLDHVRQDIAMLRTPDGHGRIELARFHTPTAVRRAEGRPGEHPGHPSHHVRGRRPRGRRCPPGAPAAPNWLASWRGTRTAIGSVMSAAPRASSSPWPSSSAEARRRGRAPKEPSGHPKVDRLRPS